MCKYTSARFCILKVVETDINEFGKFDRLKVSGNREIAKLFLESLEGATIRLFHINMKVDRILRKLIIEGGFNMNRL